MIADPPASWLSEVEDAVALACVTRHFHERDTHVECVEIVEACRKKRPNRV